MRTAVGVCLRSGYALPSPHTHSGVSSRLTGNLILIVAQHLMMHGLASEAVVPKTVMIDATYLKAHRTASSLRAKKGGPTTNGGARSAEPKVA